MPAGWKPGATETLVRLRGPNIEPATAGFVLVAQGFSLWVTASTER